MVARAPIGIFDSGLGGLTVASAIRQALPSERLLYFGDNAHVPYGDRSLAEGVSFTHLTLPTRDLVEILGGARSLKKKQKRQYT